MQREDETLPGKQPKREIFLIAQILRKLFGVDRQIFCRKSALDKITELQLILADRIFPAAHDCNVLVDFFTAGHRPPPGRCQR